MPEIKIAPSILSANLDTINDELKEFKPHIGLIHVDIMDGKFVPPTTPGPELLQKLDTDIPIDIHFMVDNPTNEYLQTFIDANPKLTINDMVVHTEACPDVRKTLAFIKSKGIKPGLTVKPNTPVDDILPHLDLVEFVMIMTVEPGWSGQSFIEAAIDKAAIIREKKPDIDIEVDGGIKDTTAPIAVKKGVNVLVASSFIFGADDKIAAIRKLLASVS